MLALKILGGMLIFVPLFIGIGVIVGKAAEAHHTILAFLLLFAGLAILIAVTLAYGHAVR